MISGSAIVMAIVTLIIFGIIFWLLWWLIDYVAVPEPFNKVLRVILAVAAVLVIINCLLSIVGHPLVRWG